MTEPLSESEADALMKEGYALLKAAKPEQALAIGRQLEERRYSGGFEIQALAYQDMGENKEAIRVLREGTERVPGLWLLWQILGNFLSDDGSFDEALKAYDTALDLPDADTVSLGFNRANVYWRMGRLDEAREITQSLLANPGFEELASDLKLYIHRAQIGILCDLRLYRDALAHFEGLQRPEEWSEFPSEVAGLEAKYAGALWHSGRAEDAKRAVARAIGLDKSNEEAQWLLREMRRADEPLNSTSYRLLIQGPWRAEVFPDVSAAAGFFTSYQVVAENLDEALAFVREFEPPEIRDALKIDEVEAQGPSTEPKGVYSTSAYHFYRKDDDSTGDA